MTKNVILAVARADRQDTSALGCTKPIIATLRYPSLDSENTFLSIGEAHLTGHSPAYCRSALVDDLEVGNSNAVDRTRKEQL